MALTIMFQQFRSPPQSHGAGDVFTGALSTALASGVSLGAACERATRAAYLHVSGTKLESIAS
ncbi:PfkB family carbohydrate kinase [Cohaesibacter celericrescens]|uniref:PfkB family carbohydrate kinase n=1 Tax=Cohaesibacter celericrescens TaxID=2067669 RepID=UPI0035638926